MQKTTSSHPHSRQVADETVARLKSDFPRLEVGVHEARDYLDGFFGDEPGFPFSPAETVAWEEPGSLLVIEAPRIVWWDPDKHAFEPSASDDAGLAMLFLHDDGHAYLVDEFDGVLHPLFPTPAADELAQYLRLFFGEGREDLARRDAMTPAVERVCLPLSAGGAAATDEGESLLVDLTEARAMVAMHLRLEERWLEGDELIRLPSWFEEMETDLTADERAEGVVPLEESVRGAVAVRNLQRAYNGPIVRRWMEMLPQDSVCRRRPSSRTTRRFIPYVRFDEGTDCGHRLPVDYCLSEGVFAPALGAKFNPLANERLVVCAQAAYFGLQDHPAAQALDLPPYSRQVECCFEHSVLLHNGRRLAAYALESRTAGGKGDLDLEALLAARRDVVDVLDELAHPSPVENGCG